MRLWRFRIIAIALLIVLGAPPAPAGETGCGGRRTYLYTFTVRTKWEAKTFARGETARVTVTVTRPAPEDPLQNGIPVPSPVGIPAEGVLVQTSLPDYFPPLWDQGTTNEAGKVKLGIRLPRDAKLGPTYAATYASVVYNGNGCPDIEEFGYLQEWPAFVIRP